MSKLKLYSYWRSSTSYKVRIAMNLKGLEYDVIPVHLVKDGGQQNSDEYKSINPMGAVPTLLVDDKHSIAQSNAILEYLEEKYPAPALLPEGLLERAYVRQVMNIVSCDIHPLNNLRVLQHIKSEFQQTDETKKEWYHKWIHKGFKALNALISSSEFYKGHYCTEDQPSFADATLIPQIYNARRFDVDLKNYPVLTDIEAKCLNTQAFIDAAPENQIDGE